ncbi:MAG: hypothetical protein P0Y50_11680 [Candidatus Brevundimonas colombiensis]|uniref:DUF2846 domain-containing protein n=1 Tax=Candidatus Brevundimonas colombiensis TaxID=3121376 RepID=A0AAJ6BL41_9CAUL|nr:hypothetical protein [Brevundimonas sp.]WEK39201.1 MAG: hypothetical protein P0Y50_11680 [Brevundimonas sp.]
MSKYIPSIVVGFVVALAVSFGLSFLFSGLGADAGYLPTLAGAFLGIFTAYIMANLVGTKLGKTATPEQKQAALDLHPQVPNQALLIVYREGFVGKAVGLALALDDQYVAQLKSPRFTALSVAPGGHQLSMAFSGLAGKQNKPTLEGFIAAPGEIVVFRATMQMGMTQNRIVVERISADQDLVQRLKPMIMIAPEV